MQRTTSSVGGGEKFSASSNPTLKSPIREKKEEDLLLVFNPLSSLPSDQRELYFDCSGQELSLVVLEEAFNNNWAHNGKVVETLDLRNTTIPAGADGKDFLSLIQAKGSLIRRIYMDGALWIADLWKERFDSDEGIDPSTYITVLQKIEVPLADPNKKVVSFQEIRNWATETLQTPPQFLKPAFTLFFCKFLCVERISCKNGGIKESDLQLLLQSIPDTYGQSLHLDLSFCHGLTSKALSILALHKSKLIHINLLHNPWMKKTQVSALEPIKHLIGLENRPTEHLSGAQYFAWMGMYPEDAGRKEAARALAAAHPEIMTLNFSNSEIEKDLLHLILGFVVKRCKKIDLSHNPQLSYDVLLLFDSCPKLDSIDVTGNRWIADIWDQGSETFARFVPAIVKFVYPMQSEEAIGLREIYNWKEFLGAKTTDLKRAYELFFARFPKVKKLNFSDESVTLEEAEAILQTWPCGKSNEEWTGEIDLTSSLGRDPKIFEIIVRVVPKLSDLYVDQTRRTFFFKPLIHSVNFESCAKLVDNLSLQNGPKEGKATYEMIEEWKWLVGPFYSEEGRERACVDSFFARYSIQQLDFTGSSVTHEMLEMILQSYRTQYPDGCFALSLSGCSKLREDSFPLISSYCFDQGRCLLTSLAIEPGSPLVNKTGSKQIEPLWDKFSLSLRYPLEQGKFTYNDLTRWHSLMGDGVDWQLSCRRFFSKFPLLAHFDLEGKSVDVSRLDQIFTSWKFSMIGTERRISVNFSTCDHLSDQLIANLGNSMGAWIDQVTLGHNEWVTDQTMEELLRFSKLTKIDIEGCENVTDEMVGFCEPCLTAKGNRVVAISYQELHPLLGEQKPVEALTSYFLHHPKIEMVDFKTVDISDADFAFIATAWRAARERWVGKEWKFAETLNRKDWAERAPTLFLSLRQCSKLSKASFASIRDGFQEVSQLDLSGNPWVVNIGLGMIDQTAQKNPMVYVYGCQNITEDVVKSLSKISLLQPYWSTPVREEGKITFSQIRHQACTPAPPAEQQQLFEAFSKKLEEHILPNLTADGLTPTFSDWQKGISFLLPYQREVLASFIGEDFGAVTTDKGVQNICHTLVTKLVPPFVNVEAAAECSFFLLDLAGQSTSALRRIMGGEALAAYIAHSPQHCWDLEPAFVHRAAVWLGFPTQGLSDWMERGNFASLPAKRAELIDTWLANWTSKVGLLVEQFEAKETSWNEDWAFLTKGYDGAEKGLLGCQEVRQKILLQVEQQRGQLYGFALSNRVMSCFSKADKIDLDRGKITSWQLEGILKSISNKEISLLDLSYNPYLSAEAVTQSIALYQPKITELRLQGNLWANDRLVETLSPYVKPNAAEEEFIGVDKTLGFRMSDEQITPQLFHITKIRGLLSPGGDLGKQYWDTIVGQYYTFTNISCAGSDITDQELYSFLTALNQGLANNRDASIELDLSNCSRLTPGAFLPLSLPKGKLSSLNLSRNQWVGGKELLELASHAKGLRSLNLRGCHNLFLEEIDAFVAAFFNSTEADTRILTIETVKVREIPLLVPLRKEEKYSERLHAVIAQLPN